MTLVLVDYRPNIRSGMFYVQITEKSRVNYVFSSQEVRIYSPYASCMSTPLKVIQHDTLEKRINHYYYFIVTASRTVSEIFMLRNGVTLKSG